MALIQQALRHSLSEGQMQRQGDREDASCPGNIPDGQRAEVGLDAVLGDGQAETQPRPVGAALREWREHRLGGSVLQSAAPVVHFDVRLAVE
jgi:hypothetical protein